MVRSVLAVCRGPHAKHLKADGAKPATLRDVERSCEYFNDAVGDVAVSSLDLEHFDEFKAFLRDRLQPKRGDSVSPWTIRKHVRNVRSVVLFAAQRDGFSPIDVRNPKPSESVRVAWTVDEVKRLLVASEQMRSPRGVLMPGWFWESLIRFGFATGLRTGALLALKWSAVDGRWLNVIGSIRKGGRDHRTWLNADAVLALEAAQLWRDESDLVFPWPHDRRHFSRQVVRLCRLAGFSEDRQTGLHALRRGHATELAGINAAAATASLGHAASETTVRHYLDSRLLQESLERLPLLRGDHS